MSEAREFRVEMESCSPNTPPTARLSYDESVHEFLGGLFSVVFRNVHGYRYTFIGFRRKVEKPSTEQSGGAAGITTVEKHGAFFCIYLNSEFQLRIKLRSGN